MHIKHPAKTAVHALSLCAALATVACSSSSPPGGSIAADEAEIRASQSEGTAPLTVQFSALLPNGAAAPDVLYRWDFGDGAVGQGMAPSYTYTKTGEYTVRMDIHAGQSPARLLGSSATQIVVDPGPLASVRVRAESSSVLTGDDLSLSLAGYDEFGNEAILDSLPPIAWQASSGEVRGLNGGQAIFTAGRQPGEVQVSAVVPNGASTLIGQTVVAVEPGYCATERRETQWEVLWLPASEGSPLAATQLPGRFALDDIPASAGAAERVHATAQIVVRRQGPVRFAAEGSGSVRLRVNGEEALNGSGIGETLEQMEPGVHRLELEYAWTDGPQLRFEADADVLEWHASTECRGGYLELPEQRYVLLETGEEPAAVADRFGLPEHQLLPVPWAEAQALLVPGKPSPKTKVILLHGLGSTVSCAPDDRRHRRAQVIANAVQTDGWERTGRVAGLDGTDFITFSYSGDYMDCDTGATVSPEGAPAPGFRATYRPADTCIGVEAAADHLGNMVNDIQAQAPGTRVFMIGHSLGGMVAAHYLATRAGTPDSGLVSGVITLDSPLRGYRGPEVGLTCDYHSPSRRDIRAVTPVVSTIAGLGDSPWAGRLLAINSTFIGSAVGPRVVTLDCGPAAPETDDLIALLFGLAAQATTAFSELHHCGFAHPDSLAGISEAINIPERDRA